MFALRNLAREGPSDAPRWASVAAQQVLVRLLIWNTFPERAIVPTRHRQGDLSTCSSNTERLVVVEEN